MLSRICDNQYYQLVGKGGGHPGICRAITRQLLGSPKRLTRRLSRGLRGSVSKRREEHRSQHAVRHAWNRQFAVRQADRQLPHGGFRCLSPLIANAISLGNSSSQTDLSHGAWANMASLRLSA